MVIDCNKIYREKFDKIEAFIKKEKPKLRVDIIYIGKDKASDIYIKNKVLTSQKLGIKVNIHEYKNDTVREALTAICNNLNFDKNCTGYFFQLPIPSKLKETNILDLIASEKDVDCLTSENLGRVLKNIDNSIKPAPCEAIISIIKNQKIDLKSKRITIVNDSNLIGKPLSNYFLSQGSTVTICNEFTKDLSNFTREADILITATGKPNLITKKHVNKNMIIIDAGISRLNGKIVGDTDFLNVANIVQAVTPVPNGVGPLTIICLFENLIRLTRTTKFKFD